MNYFYYSNDNKIFSNRIEAFKYHLDTKKQVYFYYYDDIYDKLDWTSEPPEHLEFYYKHQAQRIRDEYEYLILCYSGGHDSTNILEIFHYNNIKLDKIICVGALDQDSTTNFDENN